MEKHCVVHNVNNDLRDRSFLGDKGGGVLVEFRADVPRNRLQTRATEKKNVRGAGVIQNNYYATITVLEDYLVSFICFLFLVLGIEDTATPLISLAGKRREL